MPARAYKRGKISRQGVKALIRSNTQQRPGGLSTGKWGGKGPRGVDRSTKRIYEHAVRHNTPTPKSSVYTGTFRGRGDKVGKGSKKAYAVPVPKPTKPSQKTWSLKTQQQSFSNKYGVTTYNKDGTVSTIPTAKLPDGAPYNPNMMYEFDGKGSYREVEMEDE